MLFRALAGLLFTFSAVAADVTYFPVNVTDETGRKTAGLTFYFTEPPDSTAEITVEAIRKGKPLIVTAVIDTDRTHGDRLVLNIAIDAQHRHELRRLTITIKGQTYSIDRPHSGVAYPLRHT